MSTLTEIAEGILANAKRLDAFTSSQGLPSPSFECDTLQNLPPDLEQTRNDLVNSTQKLKRLALGPVGVVYEILFSVSKFRGICEFASLLTSPSSPMS